MSKMRISLTERGDEIRGTIELPGDPAFVLEGLAMAVERFAQQSGVSEREIIEDVYRVILKGKA